VNVPSAFLLATDPPTLSWAVFFVFYLGSPTSSTSGCHRLIITYFHFHRCWYVCECTVGVDVGDGTTPELVLIPSNVVVGCIVLGRHMNVHFTIIGCMNAIHFVGMDVRFCTMKIHDSIFICIQTIPFIVVVNCTVVQSCFCICTMTEHP